MNDQPRPWTDMTEATLPAALRILFDQWRAVQERRMVVLPAGALGFRAWLEIIDGRCQNPSREAIEVPGLWGGWLLYAEQVGQDVIAAWNRFGARAAVLRRGRIHRVAEIRMPKSFQLESDAWLVWSRLSAVRTAELAVLTLRERKAPRRKAPQGEAWLRRQLEGLGRQVE